MLIFLQIDLFHTEHVLAALNSQHIAGIALDVLDAETSGNPLLWHDSVAAFMHMSTATDIAQSCVARVVAQNIINVFNGDPPSDNVDIAMISRSSATAV
jgi:phosphoglycerate dehydrogenase-like enzyme